MKLFAVIRTRGNAWQPGLTLEQQPDWNAHAAFMTALVSDGFVLLGGPLEGTPDVLLVVRAASPEEIAMRLDADPWTANGLLRIAQISPWILRLGTLP
jgi:hypothetical protein